MQILITLFNLAGCLIILLLIKQPLDAIVSCIRFYKNVHLEKPAAWTKRKLRWYFLIYLPNELITSSIVLCYIFLLFNHRASWLFLIALSGYLFKKIIQDPIYVLHSYCLNLFYGREEIKSENKISSSIFPNAIYMPHLGYSESEIDEALSTLCLSYLNNKEENTSLIYHSDNKKPEFILKALKKSRALSESLGIKNFVFLQRNTASSEKNFLGKPGAYLADYQLLYTGIIHPMIYTEKEWDARVQFKCKLDANSKIAAEKLHLPFLLPDRLENGFIYFIYYPHPKTGYYLKENLQLQTSNGKVYSAEVDSKIYLISKINPQIQFSLYLGGIYSPAGRLLLRPEEWTIQANGIITRKKDCPEIPTHPYQLFVQKIVYLDGVKYFADKDLNIRDKDFNIFISRNEFSVQRHYQLYQRRGNFLYLKEDNFNPLHNKIIGQDFRRAPLDPMHKIPEEAMLSIEENKDFDYFEKTELRETGMWDPERKFQNFKFGWEKEFLIKDALIKNREILKGGYYLIDKELAPLDIFFSPQRKVEIILRENNCYGLEERGEIPLLTLNGASIENTAGKILVKAPFIEFLKTSDAGFIANAKDGFLYKSGLLYFCEKDTVYLVSEDVLKLEKHLFYIEPANKNLVKKTLIASPASYEIKENSIILKKLLTPIPSFTCIENGLLKIKDPLSNKVMHSENYTIDEYGIWGNEKETIIPQSENLKFRSHYIFEEEIIAKPGEYTVEEDSAKVNNNKYPLGINLYHENAPLTYNNRAVKADMSFMIINQVDSDGEFLREALSETNSILTKQLFLNEFEYGMVQPEISFANSTDSLFARLLSWAHEEFKFSERAFFNTYKEGNSYGKVSKALPLYIGNILFKEAIPAIARTHDHWEAMNLRTLFQFSGKRKTARLVENVPSNFYSFLKRKQGWISGDLLLLALESKTGTVINFLRSITSLSPGKTKIASYWIQYARAHMKTLRRSRKFYTALGLQRIATLKRTTFSTTSLLLWLILCGWLSLIIPGSLSVQSSLIGWLLFLISMLLIIVLPKFFIPLITLVLKGIKTPGGCCFVTLAICSAIAAKSLILKYPQITTAFAVIGYGYIVLRSLFLPLAFIIAGNRRRLRVRLATSILFLLCLLLLLNWYDILFYLSANRKFYWITLLFLRQLPYVFTYLIPIYVFSRFSRLGRKLFFNFKEGLKELAITTSTLLMHLVYEPVHILKVLSTFIRKPFVKISWLPQSYFDKTAAKINSLLKAYYYFYLPPLFCLLFIITPLKLHILPPQTLSLGWPIFIWSWLLGPFWAYWTCRHRKNMHRITPVTLIIRHVLDKLPLSPGTNLIQLDAVLKKLPFTIDKEEKIKIYLYFLTEQAYRLFNKDIQNRLIQLADQTALASSDLRVSNWQTLSEFSRIKIIKHFQKHLDGKLLRQIDFYSELLFNMLKKGWAEVEWENLPEKEQIYIIHFLERKHSVNQSP